MTMYLYSIATRLVFIGENFLLSSFFLLFFLLLFIFIYFYLFSFGFIGSYPGGAQQCVGYQGLCLLYRGRITLPAFELRRAVTNLIAQVGTLDRTAKTYIVEKSVVRSVSLNS
jgi:hypothetical protein